MDEQIEQQRKYRIEFAYWRLRRAMCDKVPNGNKLWSHAKLAQHNLEFGGSQYLADVMAQDFDEAYNEAASA